MKWYSVIIGMLLLAGCGNNQTEVSKENEAQKVSLNKEDSLGWINAQIMENPGDERLYLMKANYLLGKGDLNGAMREMNRAIKLDSNNVEYYVIKAQAYYDHKKIIDSRIWAEKAIEKDPDNVRANILLAWIFLIGQNHDAVMKYANTALKTDPYNAEAYFVKGMSYKELGNFKDAVSNFRTATEQDNDYFDAWLQLGLLYDIAGDTLAEAFYKNALRIDSNSLDALYDYGLHLQNRHQSYPAMRQYQHILRVNNGYQNAYYNMGYIYLEQLNNMDSAGYFFDKVLALNPYHYKALYNRGLAYERSDHPDLALSDYEKALEIKPDFELAAIGKGRLVE